MKNRLQQPATVCNIPARELTAAQLKAAAMVASGQADEQIAGELGIHRTTVFRWRSSPTFQAEVNRHREAMFQNLHDLMRDSVYGAVDAIRHIITHSPDESLKLKAACALLNAVTWDLRPGPTDPRELVRAEALQRQVDEPTEFDQFGADLDGRKLLADHIDDLVREQDSVLDTTHVAE